MAKAKKSREDARLASCLDSLPSTAGLPRRGGAHRSACLGACAHVFWPPLLSPPPTFPPLDALFTDRFLPPSLHTILYCTSYRRRRPPTARNGSSGSGSGSGTWRRARAPSGRRSRRAARSSSGGLRPACAAPGSSTASKRPWRRGRGGGRLRPRGRAGGTTDILPVPANQPTSRRIAFDLGIFSPSFLACGVWQLLLGGCFRF